MRSHHTANYLSNERWNTESSRRNKQKAPRLNKRASERVGVVLDTEPPRRNKHKAARLNKEAGERVVVVPACMSLVMVLPYRVHKVSYKGLCRHLVGFATLSSTSPQGGFFTPSWGGAATCLYYCCCWLRDTGMLFFMFREVLVGAHIYARTTRLAPLLLLYCGIPYCYNVRAKHVPGIITP